MTASESILRANLLKPNAYSNEDKVRWLSKLDGIGLVRQASASSFSPDKAPAFIIVSMIANQSIFVEASRAGAVLCLPKPIDTESLSAHIETIVKRRADGSLFASSNEIPDVETQVTKIIHQIGVPAHIKGYQYLRSAIIMAINDSEIINSVTKILYPSVAKKYSTTTSRVERTISGRRSTKYPTVKNVALTLYLSKISRTR